MVKLFGPGIFLSLLFAIPATAQQDSYLDTSRPVNVRVSRLIRKLTLEQKIAQMNYASRPSRR
ncbi:MAG TPA: hypothetical protein VKQ08_04285 [Cyclobacteriaceae bacterium]|nr:hypothetical protein [Cyclobacteriaceae bacterium]